MILSVLYSGGDGRPEGQSPFLKDTAGTEQAGISEHKTKILSGLNRSPAPLRRATFGGGRERREQDRAIRLRFRAG